MGETGQQRTLFFVIEGGLKNVPAQSAGTQEELEINSRLLARLGNEPIYRHAWRDDEERAHFIAEIMEATPIPDRLCPIAPPPRPNKFSSLEAYYASIGIALPAVVRPDLISIHKRVAQSSYDPLGSYSTKDQNAAGRLDTLLDSKDHIHTGVEHNPWWQIDLGGIATIKEIHIHSAQNDTMERFRDFALSVSIDGNVWVELVEKCDGSPVHECYVWNGPGSAWAQYVRVTLLGLGYLYLSHVDVFGRLP